MKLVICTATITRPHDAYLAALEASVPSLDAAGIDHSTVFEIGSAYISHARAKLLHKAMEHGADTIMFIDHDMSWEPDALLKVLQTPDPVVCATYRFKKEPEEYMGTWNTDENNVPVTRGDGAIWASWIPAGFLKITRPAVECFMRKYPELCYGPDRDHVDLFNHGAYNHLWMGEDYCFAQRWNERCGQIWIVPDTNVNHHTFDGGSFKGNLHGYLRRRPGGSEYVETASAA